MIDLARQNIGNPLTKSPHLVCNSLAAEDTAAGFHSLQIHKRHDQRLSKKALFFSCPDAWRRRFCGGAVREPFGAAGFSCGRSVNPYGPASTCFTAGETARPTFTQGAPMCIARPPVLEALERAQRIIACWKALTRTLGRCPGNLKPEDDAFILAEFLSAEHSKSLKQAHDWMQYWRSEGEFTRAFLGMQGEPNFKDSEAAK